MQEKPLFKTTSLIIMIPLCFLTAGIYYPYWFLNRRKSINKLDSTTKIPYRWMVCFLVMLSLTLLYSLLKDLFFTAYGIAVLDSYEWIITFYFIGCLYYSVFRLKEKIEEHVGESIFSNWALVLFSLWYVQYKINRMDWERVTN